MEKFVICVSLVSFVISCTTIYVVTRKRGEKLNYLPKRMLVIRHAESEGNSKEDTYQTTPDPKVKLSQRGIQQANQLGVRLKEKLGNDPVWIYCSSYVRSRETAEIALKHLNKSQIVYVREDPRLREQEFCGSFQNRELSREDRDKYSKFFYRWETGESAADVYDRVSLFISAIWRDFSSDLFAQKMGNEGTIIVFTHGLTSRIFLMSWLHWIFEEFDSSRNPGNCDILELVRIGVSESKNRSFALTEETRRILFAEEMHRPRRASVDMENEQFSKSRVWFHRLTINHQEDPDVQGELNESGYAFSPLNHASPRSGQTFLVPPLSLNPSSSLSTPNWKPDL